MSELYTSYNDLFDSLGTKTIRMDITNLLPTKEEDFDIFYHSIKEGGIKPANCIRRN